MLAGLPFLVALYLLFHSVTYSVILYLVFALPLMVVIDLLSGHKLRRMVATNQKPPLRLGVFLNFLRGACLYSAVVFFLYSALLGLRL
jgi:hypothetical protein